MESGDKEEMNCSAGSVQRSRNYHIAKASCLLGFGMGGTKTCGKGGRATHMGNGSLEGVWPPYRPGVCVGGRGLRSLPSMFSFPFLC